MEASAVMMVQAVVAQLLPLLEAIERFDRQLGRFFGGTRIVSFLRVFQEPEP